MDVPLILRTAIFSCVVSESLQEGTIDKQIDMRKDIADQRAISFY